MTLATAVLIALSAVVQSSSQPPATGVVRGIVLDRADGAPIADVLVELQDSRQSTRTDDKGRFELRDVQPGSRTLYVSIVGFILVKRTVVVTASEALEVTVHLSEGTGTYSENVTVTGERFREQEKAVPSQMVLGSADVQNLRSLVTNDPMRAVQVLPGVTTGDDFHSEFAVRGTPFSGIVFTLDGVPSSFLLHTIQNVSDGGSIAMLNGDILDGVTLLNGSYPQRFGNRLGAELDFHMREGSRDRRQMRIGVSGTDASFVAEGPMAARTGSWLVSIRQSYLQYLLRQIAPDDNFGFGFADMQAKVVKDLSPRQRLEVTFVAGRSRLDDREPDPSEFEIVDGRNSAQLVHAQWRYTRSPSWSIAQRVGVAFHQFSNANPSGLKFDDGGGRDLTWRTDFTVVRSPALTIEGGSQVQSQQRHDRLDSPGAEAPFQVEGSAVHSMAFAELIWSPTTKLTIVPGTLVDYWSKTSAGGVSPWLQASWKLSSSLSLRGGTGLHRQYPGLEPTMFSFDRDLAPSRALHGDFGIEQVLGQSRWQLTVYRREERDAMRYYGNEERAVGEVVIRNTRVLQTETVTGPPPELYGWFNTLDGDAKGIELLVQRKSTSGLVGWLSYSYGINRYHDRHTGETFDGDFDQRHTVNAYLLYRLTSRASLAGKWRSGSNFPMPGYWTRREGDEVFVGDQRNTERIPRYSRLDFRLNYAFHMQGHRLTLFVEMLNVTGRDNVRFTDGFTAPNGRVFGQFQTMIPRVPSGGILWEF